MLHKLIKKVGKSKPVIDMIDELPKINNRLKTLRKSYCGKKVEFTVEPAKKMKANSEKIQLMDLGEAAIILVVQRKHKNVNSQNY